MPTHKVTTEILNAALIGFEQQKKHIDAQIDEIRQMMGGEKPTTTMPEPTATPEAPKGRRRKMSAAARKRIGDAQRKRWAASKGEAESPSATVTAKPKRKLSAAGRKAISEATKKRWALKRAAAKAAPAVAKKTARKRSAVKKATVKKNSGKGPQKKAAKAPEHVPSVAQ